MAFQEILSTDNLSEGKDKINSMLNSLLGVFTYTADQAQLATHQNGAVLMSGNSLTYTLANDLSWPIGVSCRLIQVGNNLTIDGSAVTLETPQPLQDVDGSVYLITKTARITNTDTYTVTQLGQDVRLNSYTVATLPTGTQGDRAFVTDATAPTYGATVAGGGAVVVPVFFDGTNWITA